MKNIPNREQGVQNLYGILCVSLQDVVTTVDDKGRMFARVGGTLKEVVSATANDVTTWPGLSEGIYVVGTGVWKHLGSRYFAV